MIDGWLTLKQWLSMDVGLAVLPCLQWLLINGRLVALQWLLIKG